MSTNDTTKTAAIVEMAREVQRLDGIATPGPWRHCGANGGQCICRLVWSEKTDEPVACSSDGSPCHNGRWEDQHFIAGVRTAAPALAAWVLAIAPALTEWSEARKAVAAAGEAIKATYRAAGPHRAPDVDDYTAAVSAWSDAKTRLTDDERELLAAIASLDAQAVAP